MFKVIKYSKISRARLGIIKTSLGAIRTPFFMPDATRGMVKNLSNTDLLNLGLDCYVVNTLHLFLRPGLKKIIKAGGLGKFVGWERPILSDSGGYQVYSLIHKDKNGANGKITDDGAYFKSPLDGANLKLTPEQSIRIQFDLGVQMMVCFDDCPPNDYNETKLGDAVKRTIVWAKRCRLEYDKQVKSRILKNKNYSKPLLVAVIQGGDNLTLREHCAKELVKIGFDGFGFGARHIDSAGNFLADSLEFTARQIPEKSLRFGLGIGLPEDIFKAVKMGWDMFDCVIPTREGRHGRLFFKSHDLKNTNSKFYTTINITNAKFASDLSAINKASKLAELRENTKAYLNYLFKINEPQGLRLASLNNLEFYLKISEEIRELIKNNKL